MATYNLCFQRWKTLYKVAFFLSRALWLAITVENTKRRKIAELELSTTAVVKVWHVLNFYALFLRWEKNYIIT